MKLNEKLALVVASSLATLGADAVVNKEDMSGDDSQAKISIPSNKVKKPQLTLKISDNYENGYKSYLHNSHSSHSSHSSHRSHSSHYSGF
jgi:hypothetical protein